MVLLPNLREIQLLTGQIGRQSKQNLRGIVAAGQRLMEGTEAAVVTVEADRIELHMLVGLPRLDDDLGTRVLVLVEVAAAALGDEALYGPLEHG